MNGRQISTGTFVLLLALAVLAPLAAATALVRPLGEAAAWAAAGLLAIAAAPRIGAALTGDDQRKHPSVAALSSAVIPGLGQALNGELWKGVFIAALVVSGPALSSPLAVAAASVVWLLGVRDAFISAQFMNDGKKAYAPTSSAAVAVFAGLAFAIAFVLLA
ncbi:DUF5683 domain-containing protein [Methanoculleus sp. 7T]|jgi:hypothetical protein|uniref:DUF5683 domain-containing protein n=1 Tax=Methanoculleus sp. 7T TaxID=2937282 RepID=UPI0020BE40D1|nr:DUF5683 domain-containing protein [Methanoculleus sp. 7T]MCK8518546.1 DUF5683 domain-containing protein [Methanoculleus sp. 7T]